MALSTGPHARTRPWSRAAYAAYPELHGVWYGSSMDSMLACAALFDHWADDLNYRLIL